ncbi:MAG: hypothetical protein ACO3FI_08845 [Cyclobacteriaceae bacterium]
MAFGQDQVSLPVKMYEQALKGSQQLFNGTEYFKYKSYAGEHPYFLSDQYIVGALNYDGVFYPAVPLYYDIYKDQLVTPYYFDGSWMAFVGQLVQNFRLMDHFFSYFKETKGDLPGAGFYEVLYSGKIKLIARHRKFLSEKIDGIEVIRDFKQSVEYYLLKNDQSFRLNEREKVPQALKDQKTELRNFLRKNPTATLSDLVRHYDLMK